MLKRFLSLFLALCLLAPCALAEAEAPAENLPTTPESLIALNGQLYAMTYDAVYRKTDTGWLTALDIIELNGSVLRMAAGKDTLYLFLRSYMMDAADAAAYSLYSVAVGADGSLGEPQQLFDVDLQLDDDWPQVNGMTVWQDSLYLLLFGYSNSDWGCNQLFRISLTDGTATLITKDYFQSIEATADGLIGVYWNQNEAYQEDGTIIAPDLVRIDAASGQYTTLATLDDTNANGLTHDASTGYTYIIYDNRLIRFDSTFAQPELCGYLLPNVSSNGACAVLNQTYYYANWSSSDAYVQQTSADPALLPARTLRVLSSYNDSEVLASFCKANPDVAVELINSMVVSAEAISQSMREENPIDVYTLYLGNGTFTPLQEKGFVADLSSSAILTEAVAAMYPNMTAPLYKDGQLTAIPVYTYAYSIGYYPAALEKVGLTTDDLPSSLESLLDFILLWDEEYADEYPEIKLFGDSYMLYDQLISLVFSQRIVECAATGERLTFNTPEIRALLSRLDQLKPMLEDMSIEPEADGSYVYWGPIGDDGEPTTLFSTSADLLPQRYGSSDWNATPLPLSLAEGGTPYVSLSMSVSFINPASPNIDLAMQWLEYYVQHMHPVDQIVLDPNYNEPYEYEYYQENLENIQEIIARHEESLASVEEADKALWEESLSWMQEELNNIEAERWAVSVEGIAAYRELAPNLVIITNNVFTGPDNEAAKLLQRYMDGQLGADQFIREFDRIVTMMQMESY